MIADLDYFLDQLFRPSEEVLFSFGDVLMAMSVSTVLCLILAQVYRHTHRGTSYAQSFLLTMVLMGVATSIVMMIIGSNIARAFSLVGALSIIRFRTAVKDPRDTGYLFAAIIAGMGCGTQFYLPVITMTLFIAVLMVVLQAMDFGLKQKLESVVRVTFKTGENTVEQVEGEIGKSFRSFRLINRVLDYGDEHETNVYVVRPSRATRVADFESSVGAIDGVVKVALYQSDQHAPF
jgi:uncharacterized membrane protein YhiD involved in acid resistance